MTPAQAVKLIRARVKRGEYESEVVGVEHIAATTDISRSELYAVLTMARQDRKIRNLRRRFPNAGY